MCVCCFSDSDATTTMEGQTTDSGSGSGNNADSTTPSSVETTPRDVAQTTNTGGSDSLENRAIPPQILWPVIAASIALLLVIIAVLFAILIICNKIRVKGMQFCSNAEMTRELDLSARERVTFAQ